MEGQTQTLSVHHCLLLIVKKTKMKKTKWNKDSYKMIVDPRLLTKKDVHVCSQVSFQSIDYATF